MAVSLIKPGFAFGDVVAIMMDLFRVDPIKRETFVGRLQQLQKAGIPAGANSGRGTKVRYNAAQLITLMTCLDLLDCGATPATLASFFGDAAANNLETLFSEEGGNFGRPLAMAEASQMDLFFLFQPNALGYLQSGSTETDEDGGVLLIEGDFKALERLNAKPSIAINMTRRVAELRGVVDRLLPSQSVLLRFVAPTEASE
ncbi:hypothetical protein [Sphingomonas sp.]|jgi:hypothetical protein|uniref:hypothetical protein n=1 Tax=Sphingomonas sp. TaxID=28214 RepID=UPI0026229BE9|nr:hypothetical protein [Sphingomonas sp.]MDF2495062.1 hypothetical protein [Sphingomonas sp.]